MKNFLRGILFLLAVFSAGASTEALASRGMLPSKWSRWPTKESNSGAKTQLLYYGGPVISTPKVFTVFWGSNVDAATKQKIGGFYAAAVDSSLMDFLNQYKTNIKGVDGREGSNQSIGRGTYGGEFTITPMHTSKNLDDRDIQAELESQIQNHKLPVPDDNTLFMIHFPAGISITIEGAASCSSFCAYHEGFVSKSLGNIFYGVMPDLASGACSFGCGFNGNPFANTTVVSSHELVEAITDPFPTPGSSPSYPQAWNTNDGNEIGDLCASTSTQLKTSKGIFQLQREFDNATHSCAAGPYQSAL